MKRNVFLLITGLVVISGIFFFNKKAIIHYANEHLAKPYFLGALGEESGVDKDIRFRKDSFDCVTYVETILAQAKTRTDITAAKALDKIRYYSDDINFYTRNHFTETQWIPHLKEIGVLSEIYMKEEISSYTTDFMFNDWCKNIVNKTDDDSAKCDEVEFKQVTFKYIPKDKINATLLGKLPKNSVVVFVKCNHKANFATTPMVAHMGYLFDGSQLYHASLTKKEVVKVDFLDYIKESSFCGVAFYKIND